MSHNIEANSDEEALSSLKRLLLHEERRRIEALADALHRLQDRLDDPETIRKKIDTIVEDIFVDASVEKRSRLRDALARVLPRLIEESYNNDPAAIEKSLSPLISPAISREIESNKEKMIDTLYPILGGMIAKYVTAAIQELSEKINKKVEEGLSFGKVRRKIKAKLSGVSESELLLEEGSDADLFALFVIKKESGLLVAEAALEEEQIDDAHLVASMLSAIKDFVNDWISRQEESQSKEVQLLSYGDATLYIESAGSVYLVAFFDSEPDHEQRKEVTAFFAKLLKQHGELFERFDGDDGDAEIGVLEERLRDFLLQHHRTGVSRHPSKPYAKYLFLLLLALLVVFIGKRAYESYQHDELLSKLSKKSGITLYTEERNGAVYLKGTANNVTQYNTAKKIAEQHAWRNGVTLSAEAYLKEKQALESALAALRKERHTDESHYKQESERLHKALSDMGTTLQQLKQENKDLKDRIYLKPRVRQALSKAFGKRPDLRITPDLGIVFLSGKLFEAGEKIPKEKALERLLDDLEAYLKIWEKQLPSDQEVAALRIESYTDSSGDAQKNLLLSQERAKSIAEAIRRSKRLKRYIGDLALQAVGLGETDPIVHDGKEDKEASRRIKIQLLLQE